MGPKLGQSGSYPVFIHSEFLCGVMILGRGKLREINGYFPS